MQQSNKALTWSCILRFLFVRPFASGSAVLDMRWEIKEAGERRRFNDTKSRCYQHFAIK